jgi:signal transduction histidine kinase
MIVEDERVVAMHLRQQLARLGYQVPAMATAGSQALRHIQEHKPDIVLMDIHIEGDIDGIETAARIPSELQIPVIYLSAYSEEATLERARSTRPYGYLLKPFSERELHAAIQMVLERRRADSLSKDQAQRLEEQVAARTDELLAANNALKAQTAERLNAERALLQSQKMDAVGQLTGGVAHDFNNLMQVVVGNLDVLIRTLPEDAALQRRMAIKALGGAQRAVELTKRLLAFARRQPLTPRPVNINGLILGMSDLLRRALGETISIETTLAPDLWHVETDQNQLESTVLNLALNARDAMPEGGILKIDTRNRELDAAEARDRNELTPGPYVVMVVSDGGCGMDENTLARAFEPFFTTKEVGSGTGLGLSQVYGFVRQSNGHVKIHSTVGAGTRVEIYLRRYIGTHTTEEPTTHPLHASQRGTETILVVEDDPDVREFSIDVLTGLGYRVLEAADGPSALQLLEAQSEPIALLFTDVVLPGGINGAVLASRASSLRQDLKVLFTTGYARDAFAQPSRLGSDVELITKPFTSEELAARVRAVLDEEQVTKRACYS